eukprot:809661-Amorphochlora_amoeboformis.AAC.1
MAFMERLGLWGPGTSFISFEEFSGALETRGIGAFEILGVLFGLGFEIIQVNFKLISMIGR